MSLQAYCWKSLPPPEVCLSLAQAGQVHSKHANIVNSVPTADITNRSHTALLLTGVLLSPEFQQPSQMAGPAGSGKTCHPGS